jgi:hypothetical protein
MTVQNDSERTGFDRFAKLNWPDAKSAVDHNRSSSTLMVFFLTSLIGFVGGAKGALGL